MDGSDSVKEASTVVNGSCWGSTSPMRTPGMPVREREDKPRGTTSWRDLEEQEALQEMRGEKGRCTVQLLTEDLAAHTSSDALAARASEE
jgi:hypothetical protein